ncbi:unnamed protein product [Haemonchus placei]|uniref:Uncharacterized protein n=1 Tax=Haemonchus placei TaxID=6290 RepID=A0A3P7VUW6_HAEPC|nr:unnamed protein product [Haemonchus placei]
METPILTILPKLFCSIQLSKNRLNSFANHWLSFPDGSSNGSRFTMTVPIIKILHR